MSSMEFHISFEETVQCVLVLSISLEVCEVSCIASMMPAVGSLAYDLEDRILE